MTIVSIHQPQYLPWLGYFDKIDQADIFVILDDVQFKKNEWQNRNKIKTAQGWQWMTVPVIHNFKQFIKDTRINNRSNWQDKHLKSIQLNYQNALHYHYVIGACEKFYAKEWETLGDCNIDFILTCIKLLGIKTEIVLASSLSIQTTGTQRLIDICHAVGADGYLSGVDGRNYMESELFEKHRIELEFQQYTHPTYKQQFCDKNNEKFISYLSIIDLLFNHGKTSLKILKNESVG